MLRIDDDSRFTNTDPIIFNGHETFGMWNPQNFFNIDPNDISLIEKYIVGNDRAGRPDLIANDVYQNVRLYWVLIMFNKPKNPLNWPAAGDVIKYPIKDVVLVNT